MSDSLTLVYIAGRIDEANIVAQMLEDRGIPVTIENQALQGVSGGVPFGESSSPRIRVPTEYAQKAQQVVEAYEYQLRLGPRQIDDVPPLDDEWTWDEWPTCSGCRRRRQTFCPVCNTAGVNYAIADYGSPDPDAGHRPLLMCDTCDEAFEPEFYNICAWCGEESDDGVPPPAAPIEPEPLSPRTLLVLIGLVAVGMAIGGYFWWITR